MWKNLLTLFAIYLFLTPQKSTGQLRSNPEIPGIISNQHSTARIDSLIGQATDIGRQYADSGLDQLEALLIACQQVDYDKGARDIYRQMAYLNVMIKDRPEQGIACLYRSKVYHAKLQGSDNDLWLVEWYQHMGIAQARNGWADSALLYFHKALDMDKVNDSLPGPAQEVDILTGISTVLLDLKDDRKANTYIQQAIDISKAHGFHEKLIMLYQNQAWWYIKRQELDSAEYYITQTESLPLGKRLEQNQRQQMLHGIVHQQQKRYRKALPYFQKALALSNGEDRLYEYHLGNIADVYLNLGDLKNAGKYLRQLEHNLEKNPMLPEKLQVHMSLHGNLSRYYDSLGDYPKAYHHLFLQKQYTDTFHLSELEGMIHHLETSYRSAEKDKQLAVQQASLLNAQQQLNRRNTWLFAGSGALALTILLSTVLVQRQRRKIHLATIESQQQRIAHLNDIIHAEEKERNRIGSQLHDEVMVEFSILKMGLGGLQENYPGVVRQLPEYAALRKQLNHAVIRLRQTAHNLMPDALLEEGLPSAIRYFCNGVAKTSSLDIRFQQHDELPELPLDTQTNLYRIMQELIQNVIKHAAATTVQVSLNYREGTLNLTVEDNGKGFSDADVSDGLGLKSIRNRLQAMNGHMEISKLPDSGTVVLVELRVG